MLRVLSRFLYSVLFIAEFRCYLIEIYDPP